MSRPGGFAATSAVPSARAAIQELLDRRAQAVKERDRDAFMSTVAPFDRAFVHRQRDLFEWMEPLDLESYELIADWGRGGDLVRREDERAYPKADSVAIPVTIEHYKLAGIDPEPAFEDLYYTFVEVDGEWLIADDTALEEVGLYSARHLWDFGPLLRHESTHFELYVHPCEAEPCPDVDALLDAAERGYDRVQKYWRQVPGKVIILVPDDTEELERLIQSTFDLDNFVAFAYSSEHIDRGFTGHRILLNPDSFTEIDPNYAFTILTHELLHIVTREPAGPFIPIFVDEGFADYVGYDADKRALSVFSDEVAAGIFDGGLPEDFEFTTGSGNEIYRSYQESLSATHFFIERWDLAEFREFYRSLGRVQVDAGTTRYWVDRSLQDTVGGDLDRFEKLWADSIR